MKITRLSTTAVLLSLAVLFANTSLAQGEEKPQLGKFRDIIRKGQPIYLRSSQNNPFYTVQILTDEQAETLRTEQKETQANRKRIDEVTAKLKSEKSLQGQATLLLEQDRLESEIIRTQRPTRPTSLTYYEVQWVAGDYMALKRNGVEKYVPFRSIISIEKRDALPATRNSTGRSSSSYRRTPTAVQQRVALQFQYLKATEVAAVINKVFADSKFEMQVDEAANQVTITALSPLGRQIQILVQRLDNPPSK